MKAGLTARDATDAVFAHLRDPPVDGGRQPVARMTDGSIRHRAAASPAVTRLPLQALTGGGWSAAAVAAFSDRRASVTSAFDRGAGIGSAIAMATEQPRRVAVSARAQLSR
jgi:hypothetical protein